MTTEELSAAESFAKAVRACESEGSDVWVVTSDALELVAEVRRLRELLPPAPVEVPRPVRPALEDIFPRVARFAPPGTTSA